MVHIPEPDVTEETIQQWLALKEQLNKVKTAEMLLRQRLFKHFFQSPKEGTNTFILSNENQLKGTYVINRKIVEESMQAMVSRPVTGMGPNNQPVYGPCILERSNIRPDLLIKWKPELNLPYYRELTAEQALVADQMLLIDSGSPQLKVEPPSKRAKKGAA
jgi:hypothetical protein